VLRGAPLGHHVDGQRDAARALGHRSPVALDDARRRCRVLGPGDDLRAALGLEALAPAGLVPPQLAGLGGATAGMVVGSLATRPAPEVEGELEKAG
jgi:hypothetical protein